MNAEIFISGPELVLRNDQEQACKFCAGALPQSFETLLIHYKNVHEYPVTADYTYKGIRIVELDKAGLSSDFAKDK